MCMHCFSRWPCMTGTSDGVRSTCTNAHMWMEILQFTQKSRHPRAHPLGASNLGARKPVVGAVVGMVRESGVDTG